MFMRGDFHIHSTASDGCLTPKEIILLAKSKDIDTIAISDHNSISGIAEASEAGKRCGISVIPAVELSTRFNEESIHILGYFRNEKYTNTIFEEILRLVKIHKVNRVRKILGVQRNHGILSKYLSSFEGIALLKTFGAAVVLAHPVRISEKNLPSLLKLPFDGLEAKYCYSDHYQTNYFINLALKNFSFYTGGSDFHTDKTNDSKHSPIGEPSLNSDEIRMFLEKSKTLVLGHTVNEKII
ncbi:MAG: PHP domain-containing protein [Clostridiaceae bacterium]